VQGGSGRGPAAERANHGLSVLYPNDKRLVYRPEGKGGRYNIYYGSAW
jgi:hypothetical protein